MLSLYKSSKSVWYLGLGWMLACHREKWTTILLLKKYSPGNQGKGRRLQGQKTGDSRYFIHTAIAVLSINHGQLFHFWQAGVGQVFLWSLWSFYGTMEVFLWGVTGWSQDRVSFRDIWELPDSFCQNNNFSRRIELGSQWLLILHQLFHHTYKHIQEFFLAVSLGIISILICFIKTSKPALA